MTISEANKHKDVIGWWIQNPKRGVLCKHALTNEWFLTKKPTWNIDLIYIQNDKFAEERKAFINGSTVQYRATNEDDWIDAEDPNFNKMLHWRIKPKELELSTGDWVRHTEGISKISGIFTSENRKYLNEEYDDGSSIPLNDCILWKPELNEFCWFYDNEDDTPTFGKFIGNEHSDLFMAERENNTINKYESIELEYSFCKPFVGLNPMQY